MCSSDLAAFSRPTLTWTRWCATSSCPSHEPDPSKRSQHAQYRRHRRLAHPAAHPHLLAAARAGKAVLCEKPIALDMKDVEAARSELDAVEVPVMFGFNRRFDPSFAAVHAAVAAGRIGRLKQLTIISQDPAAPPVEYIAVSGEIGRAHV